MHINKGLKPISKTHTSIPYYKTNMCTWVRNKNSFQLDFQVQGCPKSNTSNVQWLLPFNNFKTNVINV